MKKRIYNRLVKLLENTGDMALKRRAKRIVEEIDPENGDKILEVGCGDGFYLHLLSNLGIRKLKLVGVDFNPMALASAKKNLVRKRVTLKCADLMKKIPFKPESFDKVIMSEVAEHLPDHVKGLKEVRRVLKKGGILVLTVPNHNYPLFWDPVNWVLEHTTGDHIKEGFWAGIWNQHLRLYKPAEIKKVVKKAGFVVDKLESPTFWCIPFNHNLLHLGARFLYGGSLPPTIAAFVSKYQKKPKRPIFLDLTFGFVNLIDKLNDLWQPQNKGVGVFVKALK